MTDGILPDVRCALVHDWLTGMRGGEKCLEVFCELLPQADLFTLLHLAGRMSEPIEAMNIHTSFVQKLPFVESKYRHYLPIFPRAIERFDFSGYDLIFSSSHCVAKGARPRPGALHICYCYSPMRYVWDMFDAYFGEHRTGRIKRAIIGTFAARLRDWDRRTCDRVDRFIAISEHVRKRIQRNYERDADVIHPPVDCSFFRSVGEPEEYYLVASAFAPYKRIDLAIETFNGLGRPLKVIGSGPDERRLRAMAGPNIEFLGAVSDEELRAAYSKCRAFIFPPEEDFGIMPIEAMACGRPVIAYGVGGALETVTEETGLFFPEQTVAALRKAIEEFEQRELEFKPELARAQAMTFNRPVFKRKVADYLRASLQRTGGM
ncbi:MAG: glycosyltransferase family 4 protein [Planctomycetes bacterium]|nr:glycosyltransferase family 4 protein [Planctomycetota bacterium]